MTENEIKLMNEINNLRAHNMLLINRIMFHLKKSYPTEIKQRYLSKRAELLIKKAIRTPFDIGLYECAVVSAFGLWYNRSNLEPKRALEILQKESRQQELATARFVMCWLLKKNKWSYQNIARRYMYRNHSSAIWGVEKVNIILKQKNDPYHEVIKTILGY